jgi:hypothetical protein
MAWLITCRWKLKRTSSGREQMAQLKTVNIDFCEISSSSRITTCGCCRHRLSLSNFFHKKGYFATLFSRFFCLFSTSFIKNFNDLRCRGVLSLFLVPPLPIFLFSFICTQSSISSLTEPTPLYLCLNISPLRVLCRTWRNFIAWRSRSSRRPSFEPLGCRFGGK